MRAAASANLWAPLGLLIVLVVSPAAFADWVFEEVSRDGEVKETTVIYVGDSKVKVVEDETMIFDVENGTFTFVIPEQKIYAVGTPGDIQKGMQAAMQMQEESLKQLPPEQRAAYEQAMQMMKQQGMMMPEKEAAAEKPKVEVKKTGDKATVAGYPCQKFQVFVNGKLVEEQWITSKIKIADLIDVDAFQDLLGGMEGPGQQMSYETSPEYRALLKEGMRLKTVEYEMGGQETTEVVKAEEKKIPASEFSVPEGYRKVGLQELMKMQAEMDDDYDPEGMGSYGEIE